MEPEFQVRFDIIHPPACLSIVLNVMGKLEQSLLHFRRLLDSSVVASK